MNQEIKTNFGLVVHELFIRWDALKLAVEHMGGRDGQQVTEEFFMNHEDYPGILIFEINFVCSLYRLPERLNSMSLITVHKTRTFKSVNWKNCLPKSCGRSSVPNVKIIP